MSPGRRPPALGAPGQKAAPAPAPEVEAPAPPEAAPEEGAIPPNPTALGFRTEAENCGHCSYMEGDMCAHPLIAQQVGPNDSCAAFEPKGDSGIAEHDAGGMDMEGSGEYAQ